MGRTITLRLVSAAVRPAAFLKWNRSPTTRRKMPPLTSLMTCFEYYAMVQPASSFSTAMLMAASIAHFAACRAATTPAEASPAVATAAAMA